MAREAIGRKFLVNSEKELTERNELVRGQWEKCINVFRSPDKLINIELETEEACQFPCVVIYRVEIANSFLEQRTWYYLTSDYIYLSDFKNG